MLLSEPARNSTRKLRSTRQRKTFLRKRWQMRFPTSLSTTTLRMKETITSVTMTVKAKSTSLRTIHPQCETSSGQLICFHRVINTLWRTLVQKMKRRSNVDVKANYVLHLHRPVNIVPRKTCPDDEMCRLAFYYQYPPLHQNLILVFYCSPPELLQHQPVNIPRSNT